MGVVSVLLLVRVVLVVVVMIEVNVLGAVVSVVDTVLPPPPSPPPPLQGSPLPSVQGKVVVISVVELLELSWHGVTGASATKNGV